MKILLSALIALCASWCAPAFAAPAAQGSKVVVPPLITKGVNKSIGQSITLRLPTQAGNVSKMVTTNLVAKGPSWIAKGDKYYSLCVPNRRMIACAPIVAADVMKGIEVGAVAGAKGEALITFKMDPKMAPKRAVYAINYFLARANKQVAHFNRMAVSYAPMPPQTSLRVGTTSNLNDAGEGGSCIYHDDGSYDCSGGGGYEGGEGGGGTASGQCEGGCNFPSTNNNGDSDPCIDPGGNRICNSPSDIPSVPVIGQRPPPEQPTSMPVCTPSGPFSAECRIPPVIGGGFEELPRGRTPWFPQSWCNFLHIFCTAGQEPDNDRGADSPTSGKTKDQLYDICYRIYEVEMDVCSANRAGGTYRACAAKAANRLAACQTTARELTDNGEHPAP